MSSVEPLVILYGIYTGLNVLSIFGFFFVHVCTEVHAMSGTVDMSP